MTGILTTSLDAGYVPAYARDDAGASLGILVGYDGSQGSERALTWAVREARACKTVLTVCQAWEPGFAVGEEDQALREFARRSGEQIIASGLRLARDLMGPSEVRPLLAGGPAGAVLCEHSREADMVVTGSRGHGGMAGLLLGSVSERVASLAHGRVVVVRGHWHPAAAFSRGAVVVGADGSPGCRPAVDFAFEQAALWDVPLLAVCALADAPGALGAAEACQHDFELTFDMAEKGHPQVPARRWVVPDGARDALLTAARDAQMVVVGSRGRGGIRGMTLGTVSQAMLQHAPCPVAVVHPGRALRAGPRAAGRPARSGRPAGRCSPTRCRTSRTPLPGCPPPGSGPSRTRRTPDHR
jgi:nucleotide-binding universal stress UspA family protein